MSATADHKAVQERCHRLESCDTSSRIPSDALLSMILTCKQVREWHFIITLLLFFNLINGTKVSADEAHSPLHQNLPDCTHPHDIITKKTKKKAIACPMIKDEEGFLSEWVAYYQMHGFDHIVFFDDSSIDNGLVELQPWIQSGFVSVRSNFSVDTVNLRSNLRDKAFRTSMGLKVLLETECKLEATRLGYDYYFSLDLDEFVVPKVSGITIVDAFEEWTRKTGRPSNCMKKYNFQSTPHILEPINLLTIEAYQTRVKKLSVLNYYDSTAPKCAYVLQSPLFTNITSEFIAKCCHFHGCEKIDKIEGSAFCVDNFDIQNPLISGKSKPWYLALVVYHYSRSLEKYTIKQKTWKTASDTILPGQDPVAASKSYDITKFFGRSIGWYHDRTMLRYSCQLREVLREKTGQSIYLRPGSFWYRNPEYGRIVTDPMKRGSQANRNSTEFKLTDLNPYNYHGKGHGDPNVHKSSQEFEIFISKFNRSRTPEVQVSPPLGAHSELSNRRKKLRARGHSVGY